MDPLNSGLRHVDLSYECETLADQILALPEGTRQFAGGRIEILAAPLGIETLSLDVKLANLERKKTYLEKLLAQLQREHASVAFPVPQLPIRDLLHAAGASSVVHAPPHNAAQASAALFLASGLGHPPMPDNFSYYYDVADRGKRSRSPKNTDRTFFCNCAFEEGVASASAPAA
jgi:hypothetical protein